jgi:hypothetical protein
MNVTLRNISSNPQVADLDGGIYAPPTEELIHTTIDSRELGIPSALPYTSLRIHGLMLSIVPIGIAWNLSPLPP